MKIFKKIVFVLAILLLIFLIIYFIPESRKAYYTKHFNIHFSSSIDTSAIIQLATVLENNYSRIGDDLDTKPSDTVQVNVYAQRWRYIKATENFSASGNIEGISK